MGGPWLLFYCPSAPVPSYALYSMPPHRMVRTGMSATGGMSPVAIGRDWIQYFVVGTGGYVFENISTQRSRSLSVWRVGGTTVPDLNSRSLARKLCAPLRVPADWTPYARWSNYPFNEKLHAGTVTLVGRSAILTGTSHPDSSGAYHDVSYAQRCGTMHRQSFAVPPFSHNAHLVIGGVNDASVLRLNAWALPALTPLKITVPGYDQGLIAPYNATLSLRKLYLVDHDHQLWIAPSQAPMPANSRQRQHA